MASVNTLKLRLEVKKTALNEANTAYIALLSGGVKAYAVGSRNLTKLDLPQLEDTISKLEKEIDCLETEISGGTRRKAVGVVLRDW
ncbi:MAG: hypothetical protein RR394_02760 [Oscillospiraceae bacterium]